MPTASAGSIATQWKPTPLTRRGNLARRLSTREVVAAAMTNEQAADYAAAVETLAPFKFSLPAVASTVAGCLKLVATLPNFHATAKFYSARHKGTAPSPSSLNRAR